MLLRHALGAPPPKTYVEDVFSAYAYTGSGGTQAITTGVDLSTKGGLLWLKNRDGGPANTHHNLVDTVRGVSAPIYTDSTAAQLSQNTITSFDTTGFTLGGFGPNANGSTYAAWSFAESKSFFKKGTVSHTSGSANTVDLSSLGTVGMVVVKQSDGTSDWFTWHRSGTAGKLTKLNGFAAEATDASISVSGTTLTIASSLATGTYLYYAWAHDTTTDGLVQCGTFTTDGSGNATATLNWEPQFVLVRDLAGNQYTQIWDTARLLHASTSSDGGLLAGSTQAETSNGVAAISATGFSIAQYVSTKYVYMAIRRGPMKTPTGGTQVFKAIARTGTGASAAVTGAGFPPDTVFIRNRGSAAFNSEAFDRLRGANKVVITEGSNAEASYTQGLKSFDMDGMTLGTSSDVDGNTNTNTYINWLLRRFPGVFDEICYTGTGANKTETHNLGAAPELWFVKGRSGATAWQVGSTKLANTEKLVLNTTAAKATDATAWNSTFPTSTAISLGTQAAVNTSAATYSAWLFATLAGVSKVFSYTGNGTNQTIDCGFSAGARAILIKRTDSTGDWFIWDSVRGIVAGNDPHLSLNTTTAEVTTDDSIDPDNSGFIVNQLSATNINVNAATYIGLAIA